MLRPRNMNHFIQKDIVKNSILTMFNFATNKIEVQIRQKIKRQPSKMQKELTVLKKQLAAKEPLKQKALYEKFHHKQIYMKIDSEMQSFFYKRSYTLQNFNFLINVLIEQKKFTYIQQVLKKMSLVNILADQRTYNYLIKSASQQNNIVLAQQYFALACKKFHANKYFYTSLIQCYSNNNKSQMGLAILREMIQKEIKPDLPVYTALVNSFRRDRDLQKCWHLHRQVIKNGINMDQTYVAVMIKVYAATHDTQKCIKLYRENIMDKGIKPMVETKNAYLKALASRVQYASDAIDMFFSMYQKGQIITSQTVRWALKAAGTGANLKSAIEILKIMKIVGIQPTKQIYNSLLRVYGRVCDVPDIQQSFRQIILVDTFKLLQQIQSKQMVDTTILNNVLNIFALGDDLQKIDGIILPMYQKLNIAYNPYTYQILMDMYYKRNDFNLALRIWNHSKNDLVQKQQGSKSSPQTIKYQQKHLQNRQDKRNTFNMIHMYLDIGVKMMDMRMVLDALDMFKKLGRPPKNQMLKFLGNLPKLPEEIQTKLMEFKVRFGVARISKFNQGHVDDPQNK